MLYAIHIAVLITALRAIATQISDSKALTTTITGLALGGFAQTPAFEASVVDVSGGTSTLAVDCLECSSFSAVPTHLTVTLAPDLIQVSSLILVESDGTTTADFSCGITTSMATCHDTATVSGNVVANATGFTTKIAMITGVITAGVEKLTTGAGCKATSTIGNGYAQSTGMPANDQ